MSKKKTIFIAALVVLLAIIGTGTAAYFTGRIEAHNVITSGEIDIDLVETMKKGDEEVPYPTDPVGGIMPGADHSKIVRVENTGSNPAWVRVKVEVEINDELVDLDDESAILTLDFNTTEWEKRDNYYYYKTVLAPQGSDGSTTKPLFETVRFAGAEMGNEYQNATIEIFVKAEGIQYENNTNYAAAWPAGVRILPLLD